MIDEVFPGNTIHIPFGIFEDRSDITVIIKYLFGQYLTLVMEVINTKSGKVPGEENVHISIHGITMKTTSDIFTKTTVTITQGYRFCTEIVLERS